MVKLNSQEFFLRENNKNVNLGEFLDIYEWSFSKNCGLGHSHDFGHGREFENGPKSSAHLCFRSEK